MELSLRRCRVDHAFHFRDPVGREAALLSVLTDHLLIGRDVDAVNLVVRNEALDPLDLRSEVAQHAARLLRDGVQFVGAEFARIWDFPFNYIFRHDGSYRMGTDHSEWGTLRSTIQATLVKRANAEELTTKNTRMHKVTNSGLAFVFLSVLCG